METDLEVALIAGAIAGAVSFVVALIGWVLSHLNVQKQIRAENLNVQKQIGAEIKRAAASRIWIGFVSDSELYLQEHEEYLNDTVRMYDLARLAPPGGVELERLGKKILEFFDHKTRPYWHKHKSRINNKEIEEKINNSMRVRKEISKAEGTEGIAEHLAFMHGITQEVSIQAKSKINKLSGS